MVTCALLATWALINMSTVPSAEHPQFGDLSLVVGEAQRSGFRLRIIESPSFATGQSCQGENFDDPLWDSQSGTADEATRTQWKTNTAAIPRDSLSIAIVVGSYDERPFPPGNPTLAAQRARCFRNWLEAQGQSAAQVQWFENNNTAVLPRRSVSSPSLQDDRRAVVLLLWLDSESPITTKEAS